jgi:hypothetical protein
MASRRYIELKDITKAHTYEGGKECKGCTHGTCKATNKKGFFTLIHFDSEHKEIWKSKQAEANLARIEDDPRVEIPLGPPLLTTHDPVDSDDVEDEEKMMFTGAWFTPGLPDDDGIHLFLEVYCCPTESKPPALIPRDV